MKLGEKIKLVRKHRGLTQRELGERLHLDAHEPIVSKEIFEEVQRHKMRKES